MNPRWDSRNKAWRISKLDIIGQEMIAFGYGLNPNPALTGVRQITVLSPVQDACPESLLSESTKCDDVIEFVNSSVENWETTLASNTGLQTIPAAGGQITKLHGRDANGAFLPDTCVGDSGGPVFIRDDIAWALAGITSRALVPDSGAKDDLPGCNGLGGIYVRLGTTAVLEWLKAKLGEDGCTAVETETHVTFPLCDS